MGIYLCTYFQSDKFLNGVLDMLPNYIKKYWHDTDKKVDFPSPYDLIIDELPLSENMFQQFVPQKQGCKNVQKDVLPEKEAYLAPIQYQQQRKEDLNPSNNHQESVPIHGKCPQLKHFDQNFQILQVTESQIMQYISGFTKSKTDFKADKISTPYFQCIQNTRLQVQSKPGSTQLNHLFKDSSKNRSKAPEVNQNQEIFQIPNIFTANVSYQPLLYYGQPWHALAYTHQPSADIHQMTENNKKIGQAVQREVMYNRGFRCILAPSTVNTPESLLNQN